MATEYPLQGVRVLDLCPMFAGNSGTQLLADLGAEVIKIESTQFWQFGLRGVTARPSEEEARAGLHGRWAYYQMSGARRAWERFAGFHAHSRNKLSLTVDMRRPEGVDVFKRLVKVSDVFIESNSGDTVEKLGVDYPQLQEVNPQLIMVRAPGYGLSGPYRSYPAMAAQLESFCGHTMLRGYQDGPPVATTIGSDAAAGAGIAAVTLMALHYRRRTGQGQLVEMAQIENFMAHLGDAFMDFIFNGRIRKAMGNRQPSAAPCEVYPCAGERQWVAITVGNDEEWQGLCRALGNPEWCRKEEFQTAVGRYRCQDEIDGHLASWTKERDKYEVMLMLQKEGVPCGPAIEDGDALIDPQLLIREHFQELIHEEVGTYLTPAPPWKMSKIKLEIRRPAPFLGQHNPYIYKELLGFSDEEYLRLEREGHIGNEPAPHIP